MPKFFVRGPSVNPNIGSPAQYLGNIQDIIKGRRDSAIAQERVENDKLFRDQTAALNERRQDFTEGAPQRTEDLRVATLEREAGKASMISNMAEGLSYSGGDRFTTLEDDLLKDPRYSALDDQGKLAARNAYIKSNPSALTDPKKFGENLRSSLLGTGDFTGPEVDTAVAQEMSRRYPTADPALIKSLLAKPDFKISNVTGTKGSSRTGGGSFGLIADPTDPKARGDVVDRISETRKLSDTPWTVPLQGSRIDFGNLNPAKTDISDAVGIMSIGGVNSPTAQESAFSVAFNPDGTIKDEFDWRNKEGKDRLVAAGLEAQSVEERVFDKKGGDLSRSGQAGQISPADIVKQASEYNSKLLDRLTPQALSDSEVVSTFLDSLGAAPDNARQGVLPNQGGDRTTPEVVPGNQIFGDQGTADNFQPIIDGVRPGPGGNIDPQVQELDGPPGSDRIFDVPAGEPVPIESIADPVLQQELAAAKDRLTIFGNGTPSDLALIDNANQALRQTQKESRLKEVQTELQNMPRPDQRTLAQTAYARSLEKELNDLQ
jgi:hypothetical protein